MRRTRLSRRPYKACHAALVHLSDNIDPVAIHLGPLEIHWYGIAYLVGFYLRLPMDEPPGGARRLGLTRDQIQDFLFYALIGVLVGGRTFFVFTDIISKHDLALLHFESDQLHRGLERRDGLPRRPGRRDDRDVAVHSQASAVEVQVLGDEIVMMLPIGITLTRLVNFINDELWGDICDPGSRRGACKFPNAHGRPIPPSLAALRSDPRHPRAADSADSCTAATDRRRRRVDVVYVLRHHAHASPRSGGSPTSRGWASPAANSTRCRWSSIGVIGISYCATPARTANRSRSSLPRAEEIDDVARITSTRFAELVDDELRACGRPAGSVAHRRRHQDAAARASSVRRSPPVSAISAKTICRKRKQKFAGLAAGPQALHRSRADEQGQGRRRNCSTSCKASIGSRPAEALAKAARGLGKRRARLAAGQRFARRSASAARPTEAGPLPRRFAR